MGHQALVSVHLAYTEGLEQKVDEKASKGKPAFGPVSSWSCPPIFMISLILVTSALLAVLHRSRSPYR